MDTLGLLLVVVVTAASADDIDVAAPPLRRCNVRYRVTGGHNQHTGRIGPLSARSGRNHELGNPTEFPRLYVCGQPRLCEEFHMRHRSSGINLWHAILGDKVR